MCPLLTWNFRQSLPGAGWTKPDNAEPGVEKIREHASTARRKC
jgi:hypothetical protein